MGRHRKDLGARRHVRVELHKPGFPIPAFTPDRGVFGVCRLVRRRGELVGARFLSARELRQGLASDDAESRACEGSRRLRRHVKPPGANYRGDGCSPSSLPFDRLMK
jgi:hypothetical protein